MEDPVQQHQGWKPQHKLMASDVRDSPMQRRIASFQRKRQFGSIYGASWSASLLRFGAVWWSWRVEPPPPIAGGLILDPRVDFKSIRDHFKALDNYI